MTKSELIERLIQRIPNLPKRDGEMIVNLIFDSMKEALIRGEKIEIRGFGSFRVKKRTAKEGRNPKTGEIVRIPEKRIPFFKVGKELRDLINS